MALPPRDQALTRFLACFTKRWPTAFHAYSPILDSFFCAYSAIVDSSVIVPIFLEKHSIP